MDPSNPSATIAATADFRVVVIAQAVWLVLRRDDRLSLDGAAGIIHRVGHLYEVNCHRFPLERTYCRTLDEAVSVIIQRTLEAKR